MSVIVNFNCGHGWHDLEGPDGEDIKRCPRCVCPCPETVREKLLRVATWAAVVGLFAMLARC